MVGVATGTMMDIFNAGECVETGAMRVEERRLGRSLIYDAHCFSREM